MAKSVDVGTMNIVSAERKSDKKIDFNKERDIYIKLHEEDKENVVAVGAARLVQLNNGSGEVYVVGEDAIEFAYSYNEFLKRPLKDGLLNNTEQDVNIKLSILAEIIEGITKKPSYDKEILVYSCPANPVNRQSRDKEYHSLELKNIFNSMGYDSYPLNEAEAIAWAELGEYEMTGITVSCGAGMINVCVVIKGAKRLEFSITDSGDWIDKMVMQASGEDQGTVIDAKESETFSLSNEPQDRLESYIQLYYKKMIDEIVKRIVEELEKNKAFLRFRKPVPIVVTGGTSSVKGFHKTFEETIRSKAKLVKYEPNKKDPDKKDPIYSLASNRVQIREIKVTKDPLYTVARGLLIYAENLEKRKGISSEIKNDQEDNLKAE